MKTITYLLPGVVSFITPALVLASPPCKSELGGYCANFAATALAQGTPGLEFLGPAPSNIGELLVRIYVFALGLVVLAAFVGLVAAGVSYLLAGDREKWVSNARTWAGNALFGLVLALLSYLILFTINPKLIQGLNLNPRPITNVGPDVGIIGTPGPGPSSTPIPTDVVKDGKIVSTGEQFLFKVGSQDDKNKCEADGGTVATRPALGVVCVKQTTSSKPTEPTKVPTKTPKTINIGSPLKSREDAAACKTIGEVATCPGRGVVCIQKGGGCP